MLKIRTILHPTDFSEHSRWAFQFACSLARDLGARLIVLHVIPVPKFHGEVVARRQPNGEHDQMWNMLQQLKMPNCGVEIETQLADGEAPVEILRVANEAHCDLILMGTHGRTGLGRVLMGSVAEQVVRQASCPVLTVKTPFPESGIASEAQARGAVDS